MINWRDRPCKEWTKALHELGYGIKRVNNRTERVHRLEWIKHKGPIPKDIDILHHCDNPPCYEIAHLFAGTAQDNSIDMVLKGRQGNQKLSINDVLIIKELLKSEPVTEIARAFNVTSQCISNIKRGTTWKHVMIE